MGPCIPHLVMNPMLRLWQSKEKKSLVSKTTTQQIKVQRPMKYSCQICGETRHSITDFPRFNDMYNMFKNEWMKTIETICGGTQGCQSFNSCSGCQCGHHHKQGYWRMNIQG
jgi:hypothetical protein